MCYLIYKTTSIKTLFHIIPLSVINIIVLFIDNVFTNHGIYSWKIEDMELVQRMLYAENGAKWESDPFTMSRLKWKIEVYPNGDTKKLEGYFVIYLRLLSLPSYIDHVLCQ